MPKLQDLMSADDMGKLLNVSSPRHYVAGATICLRGDPCPWFALIIKGAVRLASTGSEGLTLTTAVLRPGQCIDPSGGLINLPAMNDIFAEETCELAVVLHQQMDHLLLQNPDIARAIMTFDKLRIRSLSAMLDDIRRLPRKVQVAKFVLVRLQAMQDDHAPPFIITINQEDISGWLGCSRNSVNKYLSALAEDGLLETGYNSVTINDPAKMVRYVLQSSPIEPIQPFLDKLKS